MNGTFILVGCTATGKTAVANELARRMNAIVLSADSMLVYRGMDIGTAKPSPAELAGIDFRGADLADPFDEFNAGKWLAAARAALAEAAQTQRPVIVAGGTGLYINALIRGLDAPHSPDPALRAELETLSVPELAARAEFLSPGSSNTISDPQNPRRLIRLVEILHHKNSPPGGRYPVSRGAGVVHRAYPAANQPYSAGLEAPVDLLAARIFARVQKMYTGGLLEEAARLRRDYSSFSRTAGQGIGYAEALAVLDGGLSIPDAIAKTALRTRQLAKRQRTWFRRQLNVKWVASPSSRSDIPRAADEVAAIWREHGGVAHSLH